jgi:hypothetical protein
MNIHWGQSELNMLNPEIEIHDFHRQIPNTSTFMVKIGILLSISRNYAKDILSYVVKDNKNTQLRIYNSWYNLVFLGSYENFPETRSQWLASSLFNITIKAVRLECQVHKSATTTQSRKRVITLRFSGVVGHGPLKLRTKHGGDNSRSLWRNSFHTKCFSRIQRGRKLMRTQKILAQLLSSPRSYSLPKSTSYTVVKSQFLGLQLSRQILSVKI